MKARFRELVDALDYSELMLMKKDLKKGGEGIRILIENRIKEEQKKHEEFCTVCAGKIKPESMTNLTLLLGPEDNKRKVSFCAMDCMEYFIAELKKIAEDANKEKVE